MMASNAICLIGLAIAIAGDQQHDVVPELEAENEDLMRKLSGISGAPFPSSNLVSDGHFSGSELQVLRRAQALADSEVKASTAAQAVKRDKQQATKTSSHDWQLELQADKLRQATASAQVHEANAALEHLQQEHNKDLVHGNIHLSSPLLTAPFDKRLDPSKRKYLVPNRGGESLKPQNHLVPNAGGESLKPEPFDATNPPGPKSVGGSIKLRMDAVSAELLRRSARYQAEENNEQKKFARDQALTANLRGELASLVAQVAQTKARLRDTVARAKREARNHAYSLKRFKQLQSKEVHHKKMVEVEAGIRNTQEAVKQQTQAFKTSQIQLKKLLERKQNLEAQGQSEEKPHVVTAQEVPREGAHKALPDPLQGMSIPQHTDRQTPVLSSTLSDVQAHVTTQSLEQELAPKIQRLHSLLSGHTLQVAIQRLVTRTVNAKVKSAIQQHTKTQVQSEASILDDLREVSDHGESQV